MAAAPEPLRLLTIGASHYCERARWALDLLPPGTYVEDAHAPMLHIPKVKAVRKESKNTSVPCAVVAEDDIFLADSQAIVEYVDARLPSDSKLYPLGAEDLRRVREIEELCDRRLGPHVRRYVYSFVLPDPRLCKLVLGAGVSSRMELAMFAVARPFIARSISSSLRITAASAQRSLNIVRDIFERMSALLPGEEGYLVGNRFTSADLSFASIAAPVVFQPYGPGYLPVEAMPKAVQEAARSLRATPAGRHIARMYSRHRNRPPPAPLIELAKL